MLFFTDWEGPWVLTDFAYEVAIAFFNNHEFFERLSQYDDYLVLIEQKRDYEAGDTLRLLAPFIVALGVSSNELRELAEKVLAYTPDAEESMKRLLKKGIEPVVISTAYEQFLELSAKPLGINRIHATIFNPEQYSLPREEKEFILQAVEIIASLPEIEIPPDESSRISIEWLNDFFWYKLVNMEAGKILSDVKAVGGQRKLDVVRSYSVKSPMVIGDSISDHAMLSWAKENGLAVSFNGNEFAVKNSNLAIVSETTFAEAYIIEAYLREGLDGVRKALRQEFSSDIADKLMETEFYWIDESNVEEVINKSKTMRRKLRGLAGYLS